MAYPIRYRGIRRKAGRYCPRHNASSNLLSFLEEKFTTKTEASQSVGRKTRRAQISSLPSFCPAGFERLREGGYPNGTAQNRRDVSLGAATPSARRVFRPTGLTSHPSVFPSPYSAHELLVSQTRTLTIRTFRR